MSENPDRQPWHYNAFEGRPEWSKQQARENVIRRQKENERNRRRKVTDERK
ncbi:hypothetical protein [Pelagibacterium sp.]|uniref:hypothetical protein n=1 Tax=Pelagibacterium sp. TaxID=1967288 RepID=UPI003BAC7455